MHPYYGVRNRLAVKRLLLLLFLLLGLVLLFLGLAVAARRSSCVMYVAALRLAPSMRVCLRVIWWVVHTHEYGGLSVVLFVPFPPFLLSLSLSLFLSFSGLSHLEPTT